MFKNTPRLILSLGLCLGVGVLGSFFTVSSIPTWYAALNKPSFSPPNWIFGPAWTTFYILMGISFYLIWVKLKEKKYAKKASLIKNSLVIFLVHLFFNATWSIIFFGLHNIFLALVNILVIWAFIVVLMFKFYAIDKKASVLLIPYFLWVSFATVLNYNVWILNR